MSMRAPFKKVMQPMRNFELLSISDLPLSSQNWREDAVLHEYRCYTIHPEQFASYCELAEQKAIPIRGDEYGRLVGFFASEAGMLCQVHHIWEYPEVNERNQSRARMVQNPNWMGEFIVHAWPTMQRQEVRFMYPASDVVVPAGRNLYETRIYRTLVGRFREIAAALEERERGDGATLVGIYTCESPEPNEVVEIVAYSDARSRLEMHVESRSQRTWLAKYGDHLMDIRSTLLLPLPMSPMK